MAYYNEIDPFCYEVLKARIADGRLPRGQVDGRDVRKVRPSEIPTGQVHLFAGIGGFGYAARLARLPDDFDIWTAGFPCQDISTAGKGAGLHGSRSGLFFEITRLLHGVKRRPAWVLLENVPALRTRGYDRVCAEMAGAGYAIWGLLVGAWAVGAPHKRDRAWITGRRVDDTQNKRYDAIETHGSECSGVVEAIRTEWAGVRGQSVRPSTSSGMADAASLRCRECCTRECGSAGEEGGLQKPLPRWSSRPGEPQHKWEAARLLELPLGGTVDGIPAKLVRLANRNALKAYGNSIVPQVAAEIMRVMMGGPLLAEPK